MGGDNVLGGGSTGWVIFGGDAVEGISLAIKVFVAIAFFFFFL